MKNIVIVGASGHGGMILDSIEKEGRFKVVGFLDSFKERGTKRNGYEILGTEQDLPLLIEQFNLYGVILAIGDNWARKKMAEKIRIIAPNIVFASTVHPSAKIGKDVKLGMGTVIMAGVIVNSNSKVGDFCIINTNSSLGHDGIMENFSSISSGVCTGGNLFLGACSVISLGANVIENITIGEHSIVGAGSLVVENFGSYQVVYGSPARTVRRRRAGDLYLSGDKPSDNHRVVRFNAP